MCKDTYIYTHVCAHTLKHTYAHILTLTLIGIDTIHIQHTTYNTHTRNRHTCKQVCTHQQHTIYLTNTLAVLNAGSVCRP